VAEYFARRGCVVVRQQRSQFPDIVVLAPDPDNPAYPLVLFVECKTRGVYGNGAANLREDEVERAQLLLDRVPNSRFYLAFPRGEKIILVDLTSQLLE